MFFVQSLPKLWPSFVHFDPYFLAQVSKVCSSLSSIFWCFPDLCELQTEVWLHVLASEGPFEPFFHYFEMKFPKAWFTALNTHRSLLTLLVFTPVLLLTHIQLCLVADFGMFTQQCLQHMLLKAARRSRFIWPVVIQPFILTSDAGLRNIRWRFSEGFPGRSASERRANLFFANQT